MDSSAHDDWADILAFHLEAGVDVALGEEAVDRFAESAAEQARRAAARGGDSRAAAPRAPAAGSGATQAPAHVPQGHVSAGSGPQMAAHAPDVAVMAARDAARTAASLDELRALLEAFEGCR